MSRQSPAHRPSPAQPAPRLRLTCARLGIDFHPEDGAILGRRTGRHTRLFSLLPQISGSHLLIQRESDGQWSAIDLGSTNGSQYNGVLLEPHQPQALSHGGELTLADVTFSVTLEVGEG